MADQASASAPPPTSFEVLLKRDRTIVIGALLLVVAVSWVYILSGAGMGMSALEMTRTSEVQGMGDRPAMTMTAPAVWTPGYAVLMFFMWWVMMVAMMLPSASPMILLHAAVARRSAAGAGTRAGSGRDGSPPALATAVFTTGYLLTWAAFSALATAAQWGLERSGLLSGMMTSTSAALGAGLLIAAGAWQLTPLKQACLRHCRSPIQFMATHWRSGALGALRMGAHHGAFCLGCCWFLMALLFYGGVMNLYWIIGLALFVLVEKTVPAGHWVGKGTGLLLIGWGVALLVV